MVLQASENTHGPQVESFIIKKKTYTVLYKLIYVIYTVSKLPSILTF